MNGFAMWRHRLCNGYFMDYDSMAVMVIMLSGKFTNLRTVFGRISRINMS